MTISMLDYEGGGDHNNSSNNDQATDDGDLDYAKLFTDAILHNLMPDAPQTTKRGSP